MAERAFADARSTLQLQSDHLKTQSMGREFNLKPTPNAYQMLAALEKLEGAFQCAIHGDVDIWEFAIEISDFKQLGISRMSLRQMVAHGWVEHQREISLPKLSERLFQEEATYSFSDRSCFIITDAGRRQIGIFSGGCAAVGAEEYSQAPANSEPPLRPTWDSNRRELRLGDVLVKKFKWPATVQFIVLQQFEQLGWPSRISDPLPPADNICPKRRLHDAIKCLNQRMENELIRFRGDGTGTGVLVSFEPSKLKVA